ncbi:hypothetical protein JCM19236_1379 [Vibrio sp. JCM 19236]|nr:hypothetical protein JCM19236_1379 [Vibrio sp. JCM 19236]
MDNVEALTRLGNLAQGNQSFDGSEQVYRKVNKDNLDK